MTFWLVFYTNIRSYRYLVNPTREVKWHWLSLCFACGAVLSKETGIMALAINVGFGLYRSYTSRLKLRNTFKRLFWTDTLTVKYFFLTFPACFYIPIFFSSLSCNCSNLFDERNLQGQFKKAFCYQLLFWPFSVWMNGSSDLKNIANSCSSASNFKIFSRSLEQFFLTVGQNNFGNKIPFFGTC